MSEPNKASCTNAMIKSFHQSESSHRRKMRDRSNGVSFCQKVTLPNEKVAYEVCVIILSCPISLDYIIMDVSLQKVEAEHVHTQEVRSCSTEAPIKLQQRSSFSICKPVSFPYF